MADLLKAFFRWLTAPEDAEAETTARDRRARPAFATGPSGPAALRIVVADMDGPETGVVTRRIADVLSQPSGLAVTRLMRPVRLERGRNIAAALMDAVNEGRARLNERGAHVLVWGSVDGTGLRLTVRLLPLHAEPEGTAGAVELGDTLELPVRFPEALDDLVVAATLAAGVPAKHDGRAQAVALLHDYAGRVEGLADAMPEGLEHDQVASVLVALGNVLATAGRLGEDRAKLQRAAGAYRRAVDARPRDTDPLAWALASNHLALALQAIAEATGDTGPLEEAVSHFREETRALRKADYPYDWALAHMRLGLGIYRLALQTGRSSPLKDAVAAFRAALTVFDRERHPGTWAEIMNHMGVAMTTLGEGLTGHAVLQQAAAAFRQALEVRTRDTVPLLWAQTANNLGAALFSLGNRTGTRAHLDEAADWFRGASEVYREHGQRRRAAVIDNNLDRVRRAGTAHEGRPGPVTPIGRSG